MNRSSSVLICLLLLCTQTSAFQQKRKLTQAEAIRKGEEFIAEQGYTDVPPTKDKSKWSDDSVFGVLRRLDDSQMEARRNLLEPRAYGVAKGIGNREPSWTVFFRPKAQPQDVGGNVKGRARKVGRAVTMDAYGGQIRMAHRTANLESSIIKKLRHKP